MLIDELKVPPTSALQIACPPLKVSRDIAQLMRRYVPKAVAPKLEAGIDVHIAELRQVSVLFINCHGVTLAAHPDGVSEPTLATVAEDGKRLMTMVQKVCERHEAEVNKMLVDDKGTLIICSLGLPPRMHSDDPIRAAWLALDLSSSFTRRRSCVYDRKLTRASDSQGGSAGLVLQPSASSVEVAAPSSAAAAPSTAPDAAPYAAKPTMAKPSAGGGAEGEAAAATPALDAQPSGFLSSIVTALSPRNLSITGAGNGNGNGEGSGNGNGAAATSSAGSESKRSSVPSTPSSTKSKAPLEGAWSCSIGIASGQAFCGVVGSKTRHEYTLMGDTVNLAARLMGHASKYNLQILADVVTYRKSDVNQLTAAGVAQPSTSVEYTALAPIALKGKAGTFEIFRPIRMIEQGTKKAEKKALDNAGRTPELAQLRKMVAMMHTYTAGGVMILLGERGSGKKNMVQQLEVAGTRAGLRVVTGSEDVGRKALKGMEEYGESDGPDVEIMGRSTHYAAWFSVLEDAVKVLCDSAKAKRSAGDRRPMDEATVVRAALARQLGADDPRLAFAPELNAVIGRIVIPTPSGYAPPASLRGTTCAKLAVAILLEACVHTDLLIILHLVTRTNADASLDVEAWKVANATARAASRRSPPQHSLLLCIVSRATVLATPAAEVEEIVALAREDLDPAAPINDEKRILILDPYPEERRKQYLFELLRKHYAPKMASADELPHDLVEFVSENAGGMPAQIEEVTHALVKQKAVTFSPVEEDGHVICHCLPRATLLERESKLIPAKVISSAFRVFEQLVERKQLICKLLSPLTSFSVGMITTLLGENVKVGSSALDGKLLEIVLLDLVQTRVLMTLDDPTPFITKHDAHAKDGYAFTNKLMQRQVYKLLLEEERSMIQKHMDSVAAVADAQRAKEAAELKRAEEAESEREESKSQIFKRVSTMEVEMKRELESRGVAGGEVRPSMGARFYRGVRSTMFGQQLRHQRLGALGASTPAGVS